MSRAADGMSFRRYMARRSTHGELAAGAFTQAYRSNPDAPNAQSRTELLDYLRRRSATEKVLRAAQTCWGCYVRSRHR
jgi:hypothetical protein